MRKESFHWFLDDVRGITNTIIHGILTNLPHGYSGSCFQRYWQVISIENQTDLITGLVLMVDSGSKALSQLPNVFDIVRLAKRLKFCRLVTSTTATRSSDESSTEGSIFSLLFALIWRPVVVPRSDWPPSTKLFKNFHNSALCVLPSGANNDLRTDRKFVLANHWKRPFRAAIDYLPYQECRFKQYFILFSIVNTQFLVY